MLNIIKYPSNRRFAGGCRYTNSFFSEDLETSCSTYSALRNILYYECLLIIHECTVIHRSCSPLVNKP